MELHVLLSLDAQGNSPKSCRQNTKRISSAVQGALSKIILRKLTNCFSKNSTMKFLKKCKKKYRRSYGRSVQNISKKCWRRSGEVWIHEQIPEKNSKGIAVRIMEGIPKEFAKAISKGMAKKFPVKKPKYIVFKICLKSFQRNNRIQTTTYSGDWI